MKRSREQGELESITTMANYLILLSRGATTAEIPITTHHHELISGRVFECKTCNRQFQSFQALGGHRASHKKPKLSTTVAGDNHVADDQTVDSNSPAAKPKTHECPICGLEFAVGQALGGHMRRHRAQLYGSNDHQHDHYHQNQKQSHQPQISLSLATAHVPVVKKPISSGRRVLCLDLNLTPLENGLDIGKLAPIFR
ncbi:hypothetical protein Ancab_001500 [Ancistrocladus abbreviatus]